MSGAYEFRELTALGFDSTGGACRSHPGVDFFSDSKVANAAAKRICAVCPLIVPCRAYALENHEKYGVWGGLTPRERSATWRFAQEALEGPRSHANATDVVRHLNGRQNGSQGAVA
jgi:hypothetical protein